MFSASYGTLSNACRDCIRQRPDEQSGGGILARTAAFDNRLTKSAVGPRYGSFVQLESGETFVFSVTARAGSAFAGTESWP